MLEGRSVSPRGRLNKLVILVIETPADMSTNTQAKEEFFLPESATENLRTPTVTHTNDSNGLLGTKFSHGRKRFCAGQVIGEFPTGEISVQLYQPVDPLLRKAGAPPPSSKAEAWARILAVAASSYYVKIHPKQVVKECQASECPLTVYTALLLGTNPILFNVGTCEDGRIQWTEKSGGGLSALSHEHRHFCAEGLPAA